MKWNLCGFLLLSEEHPSKLHTQWARAKEREWKWERCSFGFFGLIFGAFREKEKLCAVKYVHWAASLQVKKVWWQL